MKATNPASAPVFPSPSTTFGNANGIASSDYTIATPVTNHPATTTSHGLFHPPASSSRGGGGFSEDSRKSMHMEFFQSTPNSLLNEELILGPLGSKDSSITPWSHSLYNSRDLRTDSLAQLEMILTPRVPGVVSGSSQSSHNLQSSSLDTIGSNFFSSHMGANDGFPSIELGALSVPSMDSMDSLFNPSDQSSVTTPSHSSKSNKTRLKWSTEMVS